MTIYYLKTQFTYIFFYVKSDRETFVLKSCKQGLDDDFLLKTYKLRAKKL